MYHTTDPDDFYRLEQCDRSPSGHSVHMGDLTIVFSYTTVVAFAVSGAGWFVSENVWSKTTGKHLNGLTPIDKSGRLPRDQYLRCLELLTEHLNDSASTTHHLVYRLKELRQTIADLSTIPKVEEFLDA